MAGVLHRSIKVRYCRSRPAAAQPLGCWRAEAGNIDRRWGFFWLGRSGWAVALVTGAGVVLTGCGTSNEHVGRSAPSEVINQIREVDLSPRFPQGPRQVNETSSSPGPQAQSYYGDGTPATARGQPGNRGAESDDSPVTTGTLTEGPPRSPGGSGYEMNFENAPIAAVAKAILGDILGVGYTIDPRVQTTVSLSSGRAVPKKDILYVLESALLVSNVALVREARGYRLTPTAEAAGTGSIDRSEGVEAGFGITVVPLHFVSAPTLMKLLDNFASKPGTVRADPARNLVVIQGNAADRRAAIDTVLTFDADWMRGQSVGIYPVSNSTPEPIIVELERIIDAGEGGLSQNVVKLQPIGRQNAILVVTRKPEFLKTVSTWITRLDKAGSAGTGVKVYRMRYGDARQTAALLNDIFVGNSSSGFDSPVNQLVPGGGAIASSQQPRLGIASPQSSLGAPANFDTRYADSAGGLAASSGSGLAQSSGNGRAGPYSGGGTTPILPGVRIAADIVNNALLIYANQENYRIIERTLQQLDRPQLQVSIDATIAEITLNDTLRYGVQFFLKSQDVGLGKDNGSILNTASLTSAVLSRALPGFNFLVGTEAQPRMILDALHAVTDVKVLSTPSLVVIDNQSAYLQVGDQIPITTRTAQAVDVPTGPVVNSIDYRNTGVILRVAPRINANGNVLLDIEQEISNVADTSTAETLTPTVSQRKVRSSIAVASGQTVLLAGLTSERQNRDRRGIPFLDQVPALGPFLARNAGTVNRTELIIFIRPQIIRNGVDASRIAEELRGKMRSRLATPQAALQQSRTEVVCCK
jgi:general secretion pathway protein D